MLKLLLDEHISPDVAEDLRRQNRTAFVFSMMEWENGNLLGQEDAVVLEAAAKQGLTFVTYDQRTVPDLLQAWAAEGRDHSGVIFVSRKTITSANIGGLVHALSKLLDEIGNWDWTNRIYFLKP